MKVMLDFNGVVANTREAKRKLLQKVSGLVIGPENFKGRDTVGKQFPEANDETAVRALTQKEYARMLERLYDEGEMLKCLQPFAGAIEGIDELSKLGHSVTIVTSLRRQALSLVHQWLKKRFVTVPVVGTDDKLQHYSRADVIFEDELRHLHPLMGNHLLMCMMRAELIDHPRIFPNTLRRRYSEVQSPVYQVWDWGTVARTVTAWQEGRLETKLAA